MMLSLFIFIVCFVFFAISYRKAFIALMIMSTWLTHIKFLNVTHMFHALSVVACVLFIINVRCRLRMLLKFPLMSALLLLSLSILITNFFSDGPQRPSYILRAFPSYFCIIIFWYFLREKTKETLRYSSLCILAYGLIVSLFSILEAIMGRNYYIELVNNLDLYIRDYNITEIRYGIKRCQSIFSMHTTNGGVCMVLGVSLLYLIRFSSLLKGKMFPYIVVLSLFVSVFLTGSRGAMVGLIFSLCTFIVSWNARNLKFALGIIAVACCALLIWGNLFESIFNSMVYSDSISGSNSEMRENQLGIVLYYLSKSPIIGNGLLYTWTYVRDYENILGAESLWFPVLIEQGILGALSYVYYFYSCIHYTIIKKVSSISFLVIGFIVFNTLSSIPFFDFYFIVIFVFLLVYARQYFSEKDFNRYSRLQCRKIY